MDKKSDINGIDNNTGFSNTYMYVSKKHKMSLFIAAKFKNSAYEGVFFLLKSVIDKKKLVNVT